MDAGPAQTDVLQTVLYEWITRDPEPATRWLLTITAPDLRDSLQLVAAKAVAHTDQLLRTWQKTDAFAARSWIQNQPDHAAIFARQAAEHLAKNTAQPD